MAEGRNGSSATTGRGTGSRRQPPSSGTGRSGSRRQSPSSGTGRRATDGPGPDHAEPAAPPSGLPFSGAGGHVCPVAFCPVGMALTFAEAARPEVVQHLLAAGQELMLAVKAMIDARAEAVARSGGLEHIRIR
jgi:hypothetical protein